MCTVKPFSFILSFLLVPLAMAQFVWPKPEYHQHDPGLYDEDPFITEYRTRFFAVFKGDYATFEKAYEEINAMLAKNPRDARALVWRGNGKTVKAGTLWLKGQKDQALALLKDSRSDLDQAVRLQSSNPGVYMMRAATLYIQGQYFPHDVLPRQVWEHLRDDCEHFRRYLGPIKEKSVSIHLRGETNGELGIAYKELGDNRRAKEAFQRVIALCPNTDYETRAKKELAALGP
jgi:tetratricopeptide (TPR) repeat protein